MYHLKIYHDKILNQRRYRLEKKCSGEMIMDTPDAISILEMASRLYYQATEGTNWEPLVFTVSKPNVLFN